ncbi:hypothetical protein ACFSW8_03925 [Rubritalea tangerina]|uniref:Uncharacterized protein n=2 Tax=Rubritalea tangerina TaxID=430798 RepID=A0ABW4Z917_9BACT
MKFPNVRKPPTDPGNGMGLYEPSLRGSGVSGACRYENPLHEKIGKKVAKCCYALSYGYHLIVFPVMTGVVLTLDRAHFANLMMMYWLIGLIGGVILLGLGRLVSNHLTRKEEHLSYKALTVLFAGAVVQLLVIASIGYMVS